MTARAKAIIADFLERAGWTAGQEFLAVLLTSASSVISLPWKTALSMAAGAAVVSLLGTAVQYLGKWTSVAYWPDLGVRLVKTFLASLLGSAGADAIDVLSFNWANALNLAALATLLALAKGLLARQSAPGTAATPSTLPSATYAKAVAG
jgi:Putative lactococcus lactis phage r1t holin